MKEIRFLLFLIVFLSIGKANALDMENYDVAKLGALNKITGKNSIITANVGEIATFGDLSIKVFACQKSSPLDPPESAAYLKIRDKEKELFSGWFFSSSPALSAMESGIYDMWVVDCVE